MKWSEALILGGRVHAEIEPELLQEDEGQDGVRAQPDESRNVTFEESQRTLCGSEPDQVQWSLELAWKFFFKERLRKYYLSNLKMSV